MKTPACVAILALSTVLAACGGQTSATNSAADNRAVAVEPLPPVADNAAQTPAGDPVIDAPGAIDPQGRYQRTTPSGGTLTLSGEGKSWRVHVVAGGIPNGASTAADCELVAVGPFGGNRIEGTLVPFEGDMGGLTAAEIGSQPGTITVVLDGVKATVSEQNASSRFCGMGSDLSGVYTRLP